MKLESYDDKKIAIVETHNDKERIIMEDKIKEIVTPTEDELIEDKVEQLDNKGGNPEDGKTDYVKLRVERAKAQTEKNILKDLGVEKVDDAVELITTGKEALKRIELLEKKLAEEEAIRVDILKRNALIKLLDAEKVFDSDALVNYVDFDKIEIVNGQIQDSENVILSLKKAKPKFFGRYETVSDNYLKGSQVPPKTALDKQKEGNAVGAINDYLKTILK